MMGRLWVISSVSGGEVLMEYRPGRFRMMYA